MGLRHEGRGLSPGDGRRAGVGAPVAALQRVLGPGHVDPAVGDRHDEIEAVLVVRSPAASGKNHAQVSDGSVGNAWIDRVKTERHAGLGAFHVEGNQCQIGEVGITGVQFRSDAETGVGDGAVDRVASRHSGGKEASGHRTSGRGRPVGKGRTRCAVGADFGRGPGQDRRAVDVGEPEGEPGSIRAVGQVRVLHVVHHETGSGDGRGGGRDGHGGGRPNPAG